MDSTPPVFVKKPLWTRRRKILCVVLLGLLLRLWAAWQLPVDYDEPTYQEAAYKYAQLIQAGDFNGIIDYTGSSEHPPLVKLMYAVAILVLGNGASWEQALHISRLVSVLFGTLAVWVVAAADPLAGGFMAVQTLLVKYTSQAYLEAVPLFFALLAVFALRKSSNPWSRWFFISAIALGITGAGKYSYLPILFVLVYILIWEKHERISNILLYLVLVALAFFAFNPYLWHDPVQRLLASTSFHIQYSQGAHVQEVGYPWYQPFLWVSRSYGFIWHPDVFFYFGIDGLIFLLALPGLWLDWKGRRWVPVWIATGMLALLFWPTKWPQYSLVVLPAFCLAASTAVKTIYEKVMEQDLYWEWLHNMFPRPSKKYIIIGSFLIGLLVVGAIVSQILVVVGRIGWTEMTTVSTEIPSNGVNDLVSLPDGRMLVGTDAGAALWKAASGDAVRDEWTVFNPGNSSLPNQVVSVVALDRHGVFWFGTPDGLASYDGQSWGVYHSSDLGLLGDQITSIVVDDRNVIWVGTQTGAAAFDGSRWTDYTSANSGLVNDAVFALAAQNSSGKETLWFGTLTGISSLDLTTQQWKSYTRQEIDLGWGGVSDLFVDSTGRLWASTEGGGISILDGTTWTYLKVSNSHLPYSIVEDVTEFAPGVFWIAASIPNAQGGVVAKFDGSSWQVYRPGFTGYPGAETLSIAQDESGRIWFATRNAGIVIYKP